MCGMRTVYESRNGRKMFSTNAGQMIKPTFVACSLFKEPEQPKVCANCALYEFDGFGYCLGKDLYTQVDPDYTCNDYV